MRTYNMENVNCFYLSPYVILNVCGGGIQLEHRLSGEVIQLFVHGSGLKTLWTVMHDGGDEGLWRSTLQNASTEHGPVYLEYLIQRGYVE